MGYTQNLNAAITRSIIEILEMIAGEFLGVITDYVRGTNESCFWLGGRIYIAYI